MDELRTWIVNNVAPWIASLLDTRITVGDIVIYIIAGFTILAIMKVTFAMVGDAINDRRRTAWRRQYGEAEQRTS